jgi:hypothetical protein
MNVNVNECNLGSFSRINYGNITFLILPAFSYSTLKVFYG